MDSLLEQLRDGRGINVNQGTFGKNGAAYWEPWLDRVELETGATRYSLFSTSENSPGKSPFITNTPAGQVPEGERWDLYGIQWFLDTAASEADTAAAVAAFRNFVRNAYYQISFNTQVVRRVPLWYHFGSYGPQETAASPTLALQSPLPRPLDWHEKWPLEAYLPLQSNIVMKFEIECVATVAALNGYHLGVAFDRLKATRTP